MKDIDRKVCFICEHECADSVDHIPPKNIFLSSYIGKSNLITVPAHKECNKSFSNDDDYFRIFLLIYSYWTSDIAKELWNLKVKKQLVREQAKGFKSYLSSNIVSSNVVMGNEKLNAMFLDAERIEKEVERITRGIYYYKTGMILNSCVNVQVTFNAYNTKVKDDLVEKMFDFETVCEGIFKYAWIKANEKNEIGVFRFIFYDSIEFYSVYGMEDEV